MPRGVVRIEALVRRSGVQIDVFGAIASAAYVWTELKQDARGPHREGDGNDEESPSNE